MGSSKRSKIDKEDEQKLLVELVERASKLVNLTMNYITNKSFWIKSMVICERNNLRFNSTDLFYIILNFNFSKFYIYFCGLGITWTY